MDIREAVKEVGYFETSLNLQPVRDNDDVAEKVSAYMPMPSGNTESLIDRCAERIFEKKKKKIFFLTPEIALIEKLAANPENIDTVLIAMPSDMEQEMRERITNNRLNTIDIQMIQEPFFPEDFTPKNGLIAISGFLAGGRTMVAGEVYRMAQHYRGFLGQKIFLPYVSLPNAERYDGWLEISSDIFNEIIEEAEREEVDL